MKKLAAILTAVALAGCASLEERAAVAPVVNLCAAILYAGRPQSDVAANEIARRGVNCDDHAQAVLQLQQARNEAAAVRQATPIVIPPLTYHPIVPAAQPQQTYCTTQRFGNQLQTVCR